MSTTVTDVLAFCDELLSVTEFTDFCPIGLQVSSQNTEVKTIATSVSSSRESFQTAVNRGADLLLCHHGLFWKNTPQVIDAVMRERLRLLLDSNLALAAYHLPLDAHPVIGNNALLSDALGLTRTAESFVVIGGQTIGLIGEFATPVDASTFTQQVTAAVDGRSPLVFGDQSRAIKRVAICSGGSAASIDEAAALGCDAFITGEPREDSRVLADELGILFYAAGHHATERGGIRALGESISKQFGVKHTFIDSANPV